MKLFARAGSPVCPGKGKRKFWGDKGPRIDPQRGRFSTAGWAQQRDKLLVANIKIQVFQNRLAVKGYGDIF